MNLRNEARGRDCMIRIPGVCNFDSSTTVLAHFRMLPYCGSGIKPSDLAFGAWACSNCHDAIDGRSGDITDEIRLAHAIGVIRTIAELERSGIIVCKNRK